MKDKNKRRISILVTAQTAYNLRRLADLAGYHETGMIVDKLVRYQMQRLNKDKTIKFLEELITKHKDQRSLAAREKVRFAVRNYLPEHPERAQEIENELQKEV